MSVIVARTERTLMELLEYVLRNATLPGPSSAGVVTRSFVFGTLGPLSFRCARGGRLRVLSFEDEDEVVSIDVAPASEPPC